MSTSERQIAEHALRISIEKRPFHWELEFPEVFYGPCTGSERTSERLEGAGFDAVVGNPPYDVLSNEELGGDLNQPNKRWPKASTDESLPPGTGAGSGRAGKFACAPGNGKVHSETKRKG
jgi:hypothetical protein